MNWLDIVITIPLLWFTYKGLRNGFVIELASLAALILGIFVAMYFSYYAEGYLSEHSNIPEKYLYVISFLITFAVVAIIVIIIGKVIHKLFEVIALGLLNRIAGGIFGLLKAALLLSLLIYFLNMFDAGSRFLSKEVKENSYLYPPVESIVPMIIPWLDLGKITRPESGEALPEVV